MFLKKELLFIIFLIQTISTFAQRGKDGVKIVSTTEIVNAFTTLSVNANAGNTSINVANSALNTNFSTPLSQGDLILIYQVQGASVEDTINSINFGNSSKFFPTWGRITNYNNSGNYEFLQVTNVPNATTIEFDCALTLNYTASAKVIVVRVPRFSSLTINNGGVLTTSAWNGSIGGVLAVEVMGQTIINAGGLIDVSGLGFRGGLAATTNISTVFGGSRYADANQLEGAEKGEGIAGDKFVYDTFSNGGARYTRGAAANAGGGGDAHNSGGGGGANAGNLSNWNDGVGNPDISNANFITAWNLEPNLSSTTVSSGGGRGGYSILKTNRNELTDAPGSTTWTGDFRRIVGGLGGRPLDYSTGKIFMGGGGGAGDGDNSFATNGGNGGGIILFSTYGNITGGGKIKANGANGVNISPGGAGIGQLAGGDAPGGGGGGGTIILRTTGTVSITDSIMANGGRGGSQVLVAGLFATIDEAEGPGGGGGGGYIAISAGTPNRFTNGGVNGVTNSPFVNQFPPNGATKGGVGLPNETINHFELNASGTTICANTSASLSASITGNAPAGTSLEWFDAQFNGNLLFTGSTFNTPLLTTSTTYWVRACPAPYLIPVIVTVVPCTLPVASFSSSDSTICINSCINFTDLSTGSPTSWSWHFFGSSTPTSSQQNPTNICYSTAGSFNVALVVSNTNGQDSIFLPNFIVVNNLPIVIASNDTSICIGNVANLSANGALTYSWNNGLGAGQNQTPAPTVSTNYIVTGVDANGCQKIDSVLVTVNPLPNVVASNDTSICIGNVANLSANGALTYSWNNGLGAGQNQTPAPTVSTNYIVTGVDANGCQKIDSVLVTVNPLPNVVASNDTSICIGNVANLSVNGALTYTWNNGLGAGQNQTPAPTVSTNYIVTGVDANGCQNIDSVFVTVISCNFPIAGLSASDSSICINDCINFTDLSTGSPTSWLWYFFGSSTPTSTQQNPTNICYPTTGSFNVALVISNTNGQDSIFISNLITVNPTPTVVANATNDTICLGNQLTLTGSGALNYTWDNGVIDGLPTTPSVLPTTYNVIGTDINGCSNSSFVTVYPIPSPIANSFLIPSSDFCVNIGVLFNATFSQNATSFNWIFSQNNTVIFTDTLAQTSFTFSSAGQYSYLLIVSNGCESDTIEETIFVQPLPSANAIFGSLIDLCANAPIEFSSTGSLNAAGFQWTFDEGSPNIMNSSLDPVTVIFADTGTHHFMLEAINICGRDTFESVISIDSCLFFEPSFTIPNVFSPNNDGQNDVFKVESIGLEALTMKIYNRWGMKIHESNEINAGWNGKTESGTESAEGTYFYIITTTVAGKKEVHKGTLTLLR